MSWIDRGASPLDRIQLMLEAHGRLHDENGGIPLPSLDSYRHSRSCIPSFTSTLFSSFTGLRGRDRPCVERGEIYLMLFDSLTEHSLADIHVPVFPLRIATRGQPVRGFAQNAHHGVVVGYRRGSDAQFACSAGDGGHCLSRLYQTPSWRPTGSVRALRSVIRNFSKLTLPRLAKCLGTTTWRDGSSINGSAT